MPNRLVHGERLWRSEKLLMVKPESFRAEFANLVPLALANGVFECTPSRIWADVYAFNRPSFTVNKIARILEEFERVKLLFRWRDATGRAWGFWTGIRNGGLLPSPDECRKKRYKTGPEPPAELLQQFLAGQIDSGLNVSPAPELPTGSLPAAHGLPPLGVGVGVGKGEGERPLNERSTSVEESLSTLAAELKRIGGHAFAGKELAALGGLLGKFSADELKDAWRQFISRMDDFELHHANRNFVNGGAHTTIEATRLEKEQEAARKAARDAYYNQPSRQPITNSESEEYEKMMAACREKIGLPRQDGAGSGQSRVAVLEQVAEFIEVGNGRF